MVLSRPPQQSRLVLIGSIYVADGPILAGNRVQVYEPPTDVSSASSSSGRHLRQIGCFMVDLAAADQGSISRARGVTVSSNGLVFIADIQSKRIHVFQANGTFVGKIAYINGQLRCPSGVTSAGDIVYVADEENHRIVSFVASWPLTHSGLPRRSSSLDLAQTKTPSK